MMPKSKPKQSNPLLNPKSSNSHNSSYGHRMKSSTGFRIGQLVVGVAVCAFVFLFVNLHLALTAKNGPKSHSQTHSQTHSQASSVASRAKNSRSSAHDRSGRGPEEADERHPPPDSFPSFADRFPPMPDAFTGTGAGGGHDGGVQHSAEEFAAVWAQWADPPILGSFRYSPTSSIHFPKADLQTFLNDKPERIGFVADGGSRIPRLRAAATTTESGPYPDPIQMKGVLPVDSDFSILTRKGNKATTSGVHANQDRAVIVSPLLETGSWWLGLFDGHGEKGEITSNFASVEFPRLLHDRLANVGQDDRDNVVAVLRRTYLDVHKALPHVEGAGSTGISILQFGSSLYVSNCGDSEAILVRYDPLNIQDVQVVYQTVPHKPDTPEETRRIHAAGGEVIPKPPYPGASARVLVPMPDGMDMALAMSRSLGDHEADSIGVIAEPTTDALKLEELTIRSPEGNSYEYVAIAASDGLFDRIPIPDVAKYVAESLLPDSHVNPLEASEQLIMLSSQRWYEDDPFQHYRDDISMAIHRLRL